MSTGMSVHAEASVGASSNALRQPSTANERSVVPSAANCI